MGLLPEGGGTGDGGWAGGGGAGRGQGSGSVRKWRLFCVLGLKRMCKRRSPPLPLQMSQRTLRKKGEKKTLYILPQKFIFCKLRRCISRASGRSLDSGRRSEPVSSGEKQAGLSHKPVESFVTLIVCFIDFF